ncbi:unnamed protein product [Musa acuminata subsp. malaccensis]|uniref:(wild Malaysian banana) hypothetical protein n=1 Tax=Musa acuminata subsp. malaccensis TaxID=214687 RepID=A0A8D6ZTS3_MUSAM|nr:unnamed protein product [Musa acuminata subsp. malaccensis]
MATSFFLWSSARHKADEGGEGSAAETNTSSAEAPAGKAKGRKGGAGAKAAAPKRPPQRGLGVAQLERLRLQERWKKMTELEPARDGILPLHLHQLTPVAGAVYGAPIVYSAGQPLDGYLTRYRQIVHGPVAYGGAAAGTVARSVLDDHHGLDRYRKATAGDARFHVGSPFPEPPSSQNPQCLSDPCEFCARKKRLFGNKLSDNLATGADYFEMDLAAAMAVDLVMPGKPAGEKEREVIKEFEFFPPSSLSVSNGDGSPELADRTAGDASSSSAAAASSTLLDLSLKLSI